MASRWESPVKYVLPDGATLDRHLFLRHPASVTDLAWSPDGRLIGACCRDGRLHIWDVHAAALVDRVQVGDRLETGHRAPAALAWLSSRTVVVGTVTGVWQYDLDDGRGDQLVSHDAGCRGLSVHREGVEAVCADGTSYLLPTAGPAQPRQTALSPVPCGLAATTARRVVRVDTGPADLSSHWRTTYDSALSRPARRVCPSPVTALCVLPDDLHVLTGHLDGSVTVWDGDLEPVQQLEAHSAAIGSVSCSPDGRLVATRSHDDSLVLWQVADWARVSTFRFPGGVHQQHNPVAFHPAEQSFACAVTHDSEVNVVHFSATADATARHLSTMKVVLLGDSGAGKTGLGWRLAHGTHREHDSSHGEQFWLLPDDFTGVGDGGTHREVVLWDLAGQPDYRIVHTLSLDDADLALLVFNPAGHDNPLGGAEYWLRAFAAAGRPYRIILVGGRVDVGYPTLAPDELAAFCRRHRITGGYVLTSAKRGDGLAELIARVNDQLPWGEAAPIATTSLFHRIRAQVLRTKQEPSGSRCIVTLAELAGLAAGSGEKPPDPADVQAVVVTLAKHGFVKRIHLPDGELGVLLRPELLNNLASSLVNEARANPEGLGAISETGLTTRPATLGEVHDLPGDEARILLDNVFALLLQHNICFRETTLDGTFLVFPSLITARRSDLDDDDMADYTGYVITGAVENVFAAVVVLLGYTRLFRRIAQWQHNARYASSDGQVCGLRAVPAEAGELEIMLCAAPGTAPERRRLFQAIVEDCLARRPVVVQGIALTSCAACGHRHDRGALLAAARSGQPLFCVTCGSPEQVGPPLRLGADGVPGGAAASGGQPALTRFATAAAEQRTLFAQALVSVKALRRATNSPPPTCFICYARDPGTDHLVDNLVAELRAAGITPVWDRDDNAEVGASVARFAWRIDETDSVVVIGNPALVRAVDEKGESGRVVTYEFELISKRMLDGDEQQKRAIRPVLLAGSEADSFPLGIRGRTYTDLRRPEGELPALLDLILSIHGISVDDRAIRRFRAALRAVRFGRTVDPL